MGNVLSLTSLKSAKENPFDDVPMTKAELFRKTKEGKQ